MAEHDIGDLLTRARNSLEHDLSFLAAYTAVAGAVSDLPEGAEVPESEIFFTFGFGPVEIGGKLGQNPILAEVRRDFGLHSSRYAVLAMVTSFEVFLERIHWLSLLVHHAQAKSSQIESKAMARLRRRSLRIAEGKNPPQMIEATLKNVSSTKVIRSIGWVKSIYGARRILSHRGGIVSDGDVDSSGVFRLLRRTVQVDQPDDSGGVLRFVETESSYRAGTPLDIAPKDCQEIAFALSSAADEITQVLADRAKEVLA